MAREWEEKVIRRLGSVKSDRWLNLSNSGKNFNSTNEETRKKISKTLQIKMKTEETRRKMTEARKGKKPSDESNRKRSATLKNKKVSEETRRKLSLASQGSKNAMFGKTQSEEHRRKNSEANKGRLTGTLTAFNIETGEVKRISTELFFSHRDIYCAVSSRIFREYKAKQ